LRILSYISLTGAAADWMLILLDCETETAVVSSAEDLGDLLRADVVVSCHLLRHPNTAHSTAWIESERAVPSVSPVSRVDLIEQLRRTGVPGAAVDVVASWIRAQWP
jgi:hypothetical protein